MLYVRARNLSSSDLALLGNNLRPARRPAHRSPGKQAGRRLMAAVNRSLGSLRERVDELYRADARPAPAARPA